MPLLRTKGRSFSSLFATSVDATASASAPVSVAVKNEENDNQKAHSPITAVSRRGSTDSSHSSNSKQRTRTRRKSSTNSPTTSINSSNSHTNSDSDSEFKEEVQTLSKNQSARRQVHFSDSKGLVLYHEDFGTTYYPTPMEARAFERKGSVRQLTTEEMELHFSSDVNDNHNDTTTTHISRQDFAVKRLEDQNELFLCGCIQILHENLVTFKWKTYWIKLYHGILILTKYDESSKSKSSRKQQKRRLVVPISQCQVEIIHFLYVYEIELNCLFESKKYTRRLRFQTRKEMFVWWIAIQLASKSRFDPISLHQSICTTTSTTSVTRQRPSSVFFPHHHHHMTPHIGREEGCIQEEGRTGVTHLILVRHGETENMHFCVNDQEKKLTLKGRQQAKATANFLHLFLQERLVKKQNVRLIYSTRCRSMETANIFLQQIDLISHSSVNECILLNDGAPKIIDRSYREEYREAMHQLAFEFICRYEPSDKIQKPYRPSPVLPLQQLDTYTIVICHASFIQYCLTQAGNEEDEISKMLIEYGAPIGHCSLTQIDIDEQDNYTPIYSNRTSHLPLPFRSTD